MDATPAPVATEVTALADGLAAYSDTSDRTVAAVGSYLEADEAMGRANRELRDALAELRAALDAYPNLPTPKGGIE